VRAALDVLCERLNRSPLIRTQPVQLLLRFLAWVVG
jgi:hypothetical protein